MRRLSVYAGGEAAVVRKLIRYTESMWISIRNSEGPQSEQVLASSGPQGWGHLMIFFLNPLTPGAFCQKRIF